MELVNEEYRRNKVSDEITLIHEYKLYDSENTIYIKILEWSFMSNIFNIKYEIDVIQSTFKNS